MCLCGAITAKHLSPLEDLQTPKRLRWKIISASIVKTKARAVRQLAAQNKRPCHLKASDNKALSLTRHQRQPCEGSYGNVLLCFMRVGALIKKEPGRIER